MESKHAQFGIFHVSNVGIDTLISASWVITWVEHVQSEYFPHNNCETNFAEINELNTDMENENTRADSFSQDWCKDRFIVKIEPKEVWNRG